MFFDQDETRAIYPDLSNLEGFAKQVYENVLGREFDQEGLDFWLGLLQEGSVQLPTFMLEIIKGAKSTPQPGDTPELTAQKLVDVAYLTNKTDLGAYYSVINGLSNVEDARSVMEVYTGSQASVDAAVAAIDIFVSAAQDAESGQFQMPVIGIISNPFDGG